MSRLDYLRKDFIQEFNLLIPGQTISNEKELSGRKITMHGEGLAKAFIGDLYKVWDKEARKNVKVLIIGVGEQDRFEPNNDGISSVKDDVLYERAKEALLMNPIFVMEFPIDADVTYTTFINLVNIYIATSNDKRMVMTDSEKEFFYKHMSPLYFSKYPMDWKYFEEYYNTKNFNGLKNGTTE